MSDTNPKLECFSLTHSRGRIPEDSVFRRTGELIDGYPRRLAQAKSAFSSARVLAYGQLMVYLE